MKTVHFFLVALIGAAMLSLGACAQKANDQAVTEETENVAPEVAEDSVANATETPATATDLTALFKDNVGKNVRDIEFFSNADLKSQLTELLGQEKLEQMEADWQTQVPIQEINGNYVTGGMKDDSGANPGFTIVYNPSTKNLSVAWVANGKTDIFQQQKEDINSFIQYPAN